MFIVWRNDWRRCPSSDWFLRFWLLPPYRRCPRSLLAWLIGFSSFNHISSIHDVPRELLKASLFGICLSFSPSVFSSAGWLGEWVGRCGVQHGQWMIGGSPLIIHPRQMDNTKIAQNWRTNISAFSFLVGAKINQQWRRRKNLICSTQFETCLCSMWRCLIVSQVQPCLLALQSEPGDGKPGILIESSTKFYHSIVNALLSLNGHGVNALWSIPNTICHSFIIIIREVLILTLSILITP